MTMEIWIKVRKFFPVKRGQQPSNPLSKLDLVFEVYTQNPLEPHDSRPDRASLLLTDATQADLVIHDAANMHFPKLANA